MKFAELSPKTSDRIKFEVMFWSITAIAGIYFVPMIFLAYLNPFWFREAFMDFIVDQIKSVADWRYKQVKPIIDKYKTFMILKESA